MPKKRDAHICEIRNMTDTSADIYFYGDIVSDWWGAWQAEDQYPDNIKNMLAAADGRDLNIYINSGGGSAMAGIAIYHMIKRYGEKANVTVTVDALAGSICSCIAFAGTCPPKIPADSFLMIHKPLVTDFDGNADELRKMAEDLDVIFDGMLNIYGEHLAEGVTIDQIRELCEAETWLTGTQAAEYFNVETTPAVGAVAKAGAYMEASKHLPEGFHLPETKPPEPDPADAAARLEIKNIMIDAATSTKGVRAYGT